MKYLKLYESMKMVTPNEMGIQRAIQFTLDYSIRDRYQSIQMNLYNKNRQEEFMRFCENLAEITKIDALGGHDAPSGGMRRYSIDKTFDEVVRYAATGMAAGIKTVHYPISAWSEWDKWEGGYIENFIRMDSEENGKEYFIWQYIRMDKLVEILTEFGDDLKFDNNFY